MSSAGNVGYTEARGGILNEVNITNTYTVRVGLPGDSFIIDTSVMCETTSANGNYTVTVPNGVSVGQWVAIVFETETSDQTVTVTCTTGPDYSLTAVNDYVMLHWLGSVVGWRSLVLLMICTYESVIFWGTLMQRFRLERI